MIVVFTLSSFASIVPEPSVSNRSNASLISCFCSSVNSGFGPDLKQKQSMKINADNRPLTVLFKT